MVSGSSITRFHPSPVAAAAPSTRQSPNDRIAAHLAAVENLLARRLDEVQATWNRDTAAGCVTAEADLPRRLCELLDRGGKRTRPVMVFLGWVAAGGSDGQRGHDDMVQAAAAVEMLHCFALVHDDLMDQSPVRRGHPTVHELASRAHLRRRGLGGSARFGDNIAVLVGDLAHSEADRLVASLPVAVRDVWQQLMLELLAGQVGDLVGSATADRRVDVARLIARQKTGYYTVARPLQLGAIAAGAGSEVVAALGTFGTHAGEAFALRDDVLGVFGDPSVTGKPTGDDIRSGKPTVLLALAAQAFDGAAAAALRRAGTADLTDDDLDMVQDALVERGVLAAVEAMIDDRVRDALASLDPGVLRGAAVAELTRVVHERARRGR